MSKKSSGIYKRKDGRWEGRYPIRIDENGKKIYKSIYGNSYEEAFQKLSIAKEQLEMERRENNHNLDKTVEVIAKEWLRIRKAELRVNSYQQYERNIQNHIIPKVGRHKISQITAEVVQQFVCDLRQEKLSQRTIQSNKQLLNAIVDFAKTSEEIEPFYNEINLKIIPEKELKKFIKFLKKDINETKLGILCVIYTGIRVGELCSLRWKDINFEKSEMVIDKTMQRISETSGEEINKTKIIEMKISKRVIPLPEVLLDILLKHKGNENDFILTSDSCKFLEPRTIQYKLGSYTKEAKIRKISFSELRDTFAVRAIELKMDLRVLTQIMGIRFEIINKYFPYARVYVNENEEMQKMNKL